VSEFEQSKTHLAKLEEDIRQNEELQQQDKRRDEYISIKSHVEADNAPTIRQINLVDQKIAYVQNKQAAVFAQISQTKASQGKDQSVRDFEERRKALTKEMADKERALESF